MYSGSTQQTCNESETLEAKGERRPEGQREERRGPGHDARRWTRYRDFFNLIKSQF